MHTKEERDYYRSLPPKAKIKTHLKKSLSNIAKAILFEKMNNAKYDADEPLYNGKCDKDTQTMLVDTDSESIFDIRTLIAELAKDREVLGKIIANYPKFIEIIDKLTNVAKFKIDHEKGLYHNADHGFLFNDDAIDDVKNQAWKYKKGHDDGDDGKYKKRLRPANDMVNTAASENFLDKVMTSVKAL